VALSCGCEVAPGQPVSKQTLKKHYRHTVEAILFWELLHRKKNIVDKKPEPGPLAKGLELSEARMQLLDAIRELFPETQEEG